MVESSINIDLQNVPVRALRQKARGKLCCMLNGTKVLPSPSGLPRDWRGLAHLTDIETLSNGFSGVNPVEKILRNWEMNENATIQKLREFLQKIDRYDAYDDTEQMMIDDAKHYYDTQANISQPVDDKARLLTIGEFYDAFLLYVDEDRDFAIKVLQTLENDHGLKLFVKDRDLIGGSIEHEVIMKLISERCNRLIVILSNDFIKSSAHTFYAYFAQSIGIEQSLRKVLPCKYKNCEVPVVFKPYYLLDYTRSNSLWNFWDTLRNSVVTIPCINNGPAPPKALPPPPEDNPPGKVKVKDPSNGDAPSVPMVEHPEDVPGISKAKSSKKNKPSSSFFFKIFKSPKKKTKAAELICSA